MRTIERTGPVSAKVQQTLRDWILPAAIILLAAWLRFANLNQVEFTWDQAEISKWALRMARAGEIQWAGPYSSAGLHSFMATVWLTAIPYVFSLNPVVATGFIAITNLCAVVICYFATRRWFGSTAALLTTLLFAVAPWAVIHSRKIWHTTNLPLWVMLSVVTGWLAYVRGRRGALPVHGLALAWTAQVHFSGIPIVLASVVWALIFRKRFDWRLAFASALLAALLFVPYFVQDAQHNWQDMHDFVNLSRQPASIDADAARAVWNISTAQELDIMTGPDHYADFATRTPNLRQLFILEGVLSLMGAVLALWMTWREAHTGLDDATAIALMAVIWIVMAILFQTRHVVGVATYYLTATFPAQFILIGWLAIQVGRLPGRLGKASYGLLIASVIAIAAAQTQEITSLFRYISTVSTNQGYPTPLSYKLQAAQTAMRLSQAMGNAEVILLADGDDPRIFEMPAVADVLLYNNQHRAVDIRTSLVVPIQPAVYWAAWDDTPLEHLLATLTREATRARIPLRENIGSFRFYRWPGGTPAIPNVQPLSGGPYTFANGAQLTGYRVSGQLKPGGTLQWTLVWRATQTHTDPDDYHWFNHLVDSQGQQRAQQDQPSYLSTYWRIGDTILNSFDLPIPPDAPPGNYTIRVGMYPYPTLNAKRVPVTDAANQTAEFVEIGPLQINK